MKRALVFAFLCALVVRILAGWVVGPAQPNEIRYITLARGIASGDGFTGLDQRFPDIIQPPLFPLVLAAVQWLPVPELAASRAVSILLGALLVVPGALLAGRLFGIREARRAGLLIALHPLLVYYSCQALTESLFVMLVSCGALVTFRCLSLGDAGPLGRAALSAGLLFGLSLLVRPEGLTFVIVSGLIIVVELLRRNVPRGRVAVAALCLAAGFAAAAVPYMTWVHARSGQWFMAPKAVLFQVHRKQAERGLRERWIEPALSPLFYERAWFELNDDATGIRSHEMFGGAGPAGGGPGPDQDHTTLQSLSLAARTVVRNLSELYLETIKSGLVLPPILLLLGVAGLLSRPLAGPFRVPAAVTLAFFGGSFSFLLSHVDPRFLFTAVFFAMPWMAQGWCEVERVASASITTPDTARAGTRRRIVSAIVAAVIIGLTLLPLSAIVFQTRDRWTGHRDMGLWVRDHIDGHPTVMGVVPTVSYYAGAGYEVLPYAEMKDVLRYARHRGVSHIVAEQGVIVSRRPQLVTLLTPERPHPGLEHLTTLHPGTSRAIHLYRLEPAEDRQPHRRIDP